MDKYSYRFQQQQKGPKRGEIHPVWRGIGCLLIVLIPAVAFSASRVIIEAAIEYGWFTVPRDLMRGPSGLPFAFTYGELLGTLILMLLGYGLVVVIYTLVFRMVGPPRYGPMDAPPPKRQKRRRR